MATVLTIGGARFMGRFTVREFLDRGDDLTLFTRGNTPIPFGDEVDHVQGDRRNEEELEAAYGTVDPDIVVDFAAFYPDDVRSATELFADVDAYVYVSSTSAYDRERAFDAREDASPLREYEPDRGSDDDGASYGARKAEGDRIVRAAAAERGVNAMSVRPTAIYGPYDPTERQNYWIDRIDRFDRIVVPGDGRTPVPLGYAEDVARAIRLLVERGEPGEAYNVANRSTPVVEDFVEHVADALDTGVTVAHASRADLAAVDLHPSDFSYCRAHPYVVSTEKLAALGWESTPLETGVVEAVADHRDREPDGSRHGPDRDTEQRLLGMLGGPIHVGSPE